MALDEELRATPPQPPVNQFTNVPLPPSIVKFRLPVKDPKQIFGWFDIAESALVGETETTIVYEIQEEFPQIFDVLAQKIVGTVGTETPHKVKGLPVPTNVPLHPPMYHSTVEPVPPEAESVIQPKLDE